MKRTRLRRSPLRRARRPIARTAIQRGRVLVGRRAAARRKAGGPRAVGRPALPVVAYRELCRLVHLRSRGRCEAACGRPGTDLEHALPRSRGGADDGNNVWLACRECHRRKEAPYARGRLLVTALGGGRFRFQDVTGPSKWDYLVLRTWESQG